MKIKKKRTKRTQRKRTNKFKEKRDVKRKLPKLAGKTKIKETKSVKKEKK